MATQIIDRRTVVRPGPQGDVTPAALAAQSAAESARDASAASAAEAQQYAQTAGTQVDSNVAGFLNTTTSATYAAGMVLAGKAQGWATIRHVISTSPSCEYEVTTIHGGPWALYKTQGDNTNTDGTNQRETIRNFYNTHGFPAVFNCSAWASANGGHWYDDGPQHRVGLQIDNGVAVQNFGVVQSEDRVGSDIESLLIMKDGSYKIAYAADGKTAADYVAEGAIHSFGYGPIVVKNGVLRDIESGSTFTGFIPVTAQIIFGVRADGTYVLIQSHGRDNTAYGPAYGIGGNDIGRLALAEHCEVAVVLDGGGSVQGIWNGVLEHPSSDTGGVRAIGGGFLALNVAAVGPYESATFDLTSYLSSGYSILDGVAPSIRQVGPMVHYNCAFMFPSTAPASGWQYYMTQALTPERLRRAGGPVKGVASGSAGSVLPLSEDGVTRQPQVFYNGSAMFCQAQLSWPAQFADL